MIGRAQHLVALAWTVLWVSTVSAAPPNRFNYQGLILDGDGAPLEGNQTIYFSLYEGGSAGVAGSGNLLYKESAGITLDNGVVNHTVGAGTPISGTLTPDKFATTSDLFLEVASGVDTNVILPRTRLESVPFALHSGNTDGKIPLSGPPPIVISQTGSYYLTENMTATAGGNPCISINAPNVSLDLNGYTVNGAGHGVDGVKATALGINAVVENGRVTRCVDGINLAVGAVVDRIFAVNNSQDGIETLTSSTITRCFATANSGKGINATEGAIIRDAQAQGNTFQGIDATNAALVVNCIVRNNGGTGIETGNDSRVESCIAANSGGAGISVGTTSVVADCSVLDAGGSGIISGSFGRVENCLVDSCNIHGIDANTNSEVSRCTLRSIGQTGIDASGQARVMDCFVSNSSGTGIDCGSNSQVSGNRVYVSGLDGIAAGTNSSVTNNIMDGDAAGNNPGGRSAGVGIDAANYSRITDNAVADYTTGTRVGTSGVGLRNSYDNCATNTDGAGTHAPVQALGSATNPFASYSY